MLLVMSNVGYLAPPDEKPEQEELWTETWKRVNRFLPNFYAELFPEEAQKPQTERKSKDTKENTKPVDEKAQGAEGEVAAEAEAEEEA
jgi:brefeldin A-resistance guanine nucleotide exchange factor 1